MKDPYDPIRIFVVCFALAAIGGSIQILVSKETPTFRYAMGVVLGSGMTGLILALCWWNEMRDNIWLLIGTSAAAGTLGNQVRIALVNAIIKRLLGIEVKDDAK